MKAKGATMGRNRDEAVFSPLEAILSPMSIVLTVCVSSAIDLIFGVFPARSAALLDPIVALRRN